MRKKLQFSGQINPKRNEQYKALKKLHNSNLSVQFEGAIGIGGRTSKKRIGQSNTRKVLQWT